MRGHGKREKEEQKGGREREAQVQKGTRVLSHGDERTQFWSVLGGTRLARTEAP